MAQGVITIGDRKFAVGLYWQPSPTKAIAKSAKEAAAQPGQEADFFSARTASKMGAVPQFGLGWQAAGHRIGMPSAACSMANIIPGSWAGGFRVPEGFWIVVVRDDLITPDGDEIYEDEAEAIARLEREVEQSGLDRVYAPQNWPFTQADHSSLTFIIGRQADGRLQPIRIPRKPILIGLAAVAVLATGSYVGYSMYKTAQDRAQQAQLAKFAAEGLAESTRKSQEEAEILRQKQQDEALLEAQIRDLQSGQQGVVKYEPLWERDPPIAVWAAACQTPMAGIRAAMAGWNLTSVSCNSGQLALNWSRATGPAYTPSEVFVDDTGTQASLTRALEGLIPRGREDQDLWSPPDVTRFFLQRGWNVNLQRIPDPPPPQTSGQLGVLPGGTPPPPPPPPPWVKRAFTIRTPSPPWNEVIEMSRMPGITINSLSWSMGADWILEGVIYEKR